ncbi:SAM-dependent methyltransferase [Chitinophaga oryziterrae]|uniref:S-adenosyl-L-methionine-dependent methyltransferase n=1 Tax=Chitinophaga oryziterrae TaxID=1031224 RepID=A0A6N8J3Z8_9BACT|nr:SAM-dependent methyltransferase [Chitinophaga oryziterrae]MVT39644.1 SAM-dependent methyltransferase [Chitinophaga oryziterrae]
MKMVTASKAAAYLALLRAVASNVPLKERLFYDPYAKLFLPPHLKLVEWLSRVTFLNRIISWYIDQRWTGALTSCVARNRLIDVMTTNLVKDEGINQVIIFGAGYDCRVHRLKMKERVMFVEIDDPVKQEAKLAILENSPLKPVIHVDSISVDFHKQRLEDVLPGLFHNTHYKTMFIWEGVTNYFTAPIADKIFQYFKSFLPGTFIIFTYVDEKVLSNPELFVGAANVTKLLQSNNEFWNFGIDPAKISEFLAGYNMKLIYDEGADAYREIYFGKERAAKMKGYEYYRVAMAVVQ